MAPGKICRTRCAPPKSISASDEIPALGEPGHVVDLAGLSCKVHRLLSQAVDALTLAGAAMAVTRIAWASSSLSRGSSLSWCRRNWAA